jgi:hypothetical protein
MFRRYRDASRCYFYSSDVLYPLSGAGYEQSGRPWESEFRRSRWFTCGWTLHYILVINALDECGNDNNIRTILHFLVKARLFKAVRLRVFLTSRPEVSILNGFIEMPNTEHQDFVLHNISPLIEDHDIALHFQV